MPVKVLVWGSVLEVGKGPMNIGGIKLTLVMGSELECLK